MTWELWGVGGDTMFFSTPTLVTPLYAQDYARSDVNTGVAHLLLFYYDRLYAVAGYHERRIRPKNLGCIPTRSRMYEPLKDS